MNYIYDILVNLNKKYYDFFEWNQSDPVCHIRKIPIIKINSYDLLNILANNIVIGNDFIEKIENKTDLFNTVKQNLKYCCLFTDSNEVIVVAFDKKGNSILKSDLLIDEALDVLEISLHMKEKPIKYSVICSDFSNSFLTRNTLKMRSNILKKLNSLSEKDISKLRYLYYDCFNEEGIEHAKMLNKIKKNIYNDVILNKVNKFFRLISNYK